MTMPHAKKHHIKICLGSSCFSRGNHTNVDVIKKHIETNGLDADILFTGGLCEERCSKGPVVSINGKTYEEVNLSRLHKILQEELVC